MSLRKSGAAGAVAMLVIGGLLVAGCGNDGGTTTTTTTEAGAAAGAEAATLTIKMGEFFFDPKDATAKAGPTTIEAPNQGKVEHELVLFKTDMNPAKLPPEASGEVDEEKMDKVAESAGEIPDVEPGETKSADFELTPGRYVMFCNLPGHYAAGMYGTLTVTK
jgi:uncharacterized cupredoxin-like copper-binding protein